MVMMVVVPKAEAKADAISVEAVPSMVVPTTVVVMAPAAMVMMSPMAMAMPMAHLRHLAAAGFGLGGTSACQWCGRRRGTGKHGAQQQRAEQVLHERPPLLLVMVVVVLMVFSGVSRSFEL
jgi:hypothetical protein